MRATVRFHETVTPPVETRFFLVTNQRYRVTWNCENSIFYILAGTHGGDRSADIAPPNMTCETVNDLRRSGLILMAYDTILFI